MEPITSIEEAKKVIESFEGFPEELMLPISDQLQDPLGMNIAIITDSILKRGWMPEVSSRKKAVEKTEGQVLYFDIYHTNQKRRFYLHYL